jgi:hypothetical protein
MRMVPEGPPTVDHREVAKKMDHQCFEKAAKRGEQTFTLVEHDPTAPRTILRWIELNWETAPVAKLRDAFEDALAMQHSPIAKRPAD